MHQKEVEFSALELLDDLYDEKDGTGLSADGITGMFFCPTKPLYRKILK